MSGTAYDEEFLKPFIDRIVAGESISKVSRESGLYRGTLAKALYRRNHPQAAAQPAAPHQPHLAPGSPPVRILIYDIETIPNRGYFFDLFQPHRAIPTPFIEREKSICTIAYKFLGDDLTKVISIADFPATFVDPYDDKQVLRTFLPIWEQAHYTVAHYGDKFDRRFIAGRLLANGLPTLPPVNQLDTYKLAKKHFNLNSNKLDYLGTILGVGNKNKTEASLWVRCAKGDRGAVKEMADYNAQDVALLEAVFVKLLPHVQSRMNLNLLCDEPILRCKQCGSDHLEQRGFEFTAASLRHRFHCLSCGSWSIMRPKK